MLVWWQPEPPQSAALTHFLEQKGLPVGPWMHRPELH
jgi:hypothetical protein